MSVSRQQTVVLALGPLVLIGVCYAVAAPQAATLRRPPLIERTWRAAHVAGENLQASCVVQAEHLKQQLPAGWTILVRAPLVIAGDYPESTLDEIYRETLVPTRRALSVSYFDTDPQQPVAILLCSGEASYEACNRLYSDQSRSEYAGVYSRTDRRLILNLSTGEGALAHELTHALAHADFPDMPEWFDEGLASLHEECQISDDHQRLIGLANWRLTQLRSALAQGNVPPLQTLLGESFARGAKGPLAYAYARSLCLYLQEVGLLRDYYRKCRTNIARDPTGAHALCELLECAELAQVESHFLEWLITTDQRVAAE